MDMKTAFPSMYIKAADLQGEDFRVKIKKVTMEEIGSDRKPIVYFDGASKGLVLNRTNNDAIGSAFGWDSDSWTGKEIILFSMKVPFQGQQVDAIRVRVPKQKPATTNVAPNARTRAEQPAMAGNGPAPVEAYEDLDDEIPF
jgi:hypothetical protein